MRSGDDLSSLFEIIKLQLAFSQIAELSLDNVFLNARWKPPQKEKEGMNGANAKLTEMSYVYRASACVYRSISWALDSFSFAELLSLRRPARGFLYKAFLDN